MSIKDKLFSKKVKGIPVIAITLMLAVGLGSAAVLSYFGTVEGDVEVEQAIKLNGEKGEASLSLFDSTSVLAGNNTVKKYSVTNNMDDAYDLSYKSRLYNNSNDEWIVRDVSGTEINWTEEAGEEIGINTKYVTYFENAGSDLDSYEEPDSSECNVYVEDGSSSSSPDGSETDPYEVLQTGINNAGATDTICVKSGTYDKVEVTKEVTLESFNGQGAATIKGIVPKDVDGVIIRGFKLPPENDLASSGKAGIYLGSGSGWTPPTGTTIEYNEFDGTGISGAAAAPYGIHTSGGDISNTVVKNNHFHDLSNAFYMNPHDGIIEVKNNTFDTGITAMGANIEYNVFSDGTGVTVGNGYIDAGFSSRNVVIEYNNFEGDSYVKNADYTAYSGDGEAQDALNNYWDKDGINIAEVDTSKSWVEEERPVNAGWDFFDSVEESENDKLAAVNQFDIHMSGNSDYKIVTEIS